MRIAKKSCSKTVLRHTNKRWGERRQEKFTKETEKEQTWREENRSKYSVLVKELKFAKSTVL